MEKPPTNAENTSNNRNRKKRCGKTLHAKDETTNELRESDTDEDYPEKAIEECRPVEPESQEPVTAPDEDNDGETPDDDPELMNVIDEDEVEQEGGEGLHNNKVLNENIPAQNESPTFPLTNMQPWQMGPYSPLPPSYSWSPIVQRPWQTFQPFYPVAQVGML